MWFEKVDIYFIKVVLIFKYIYTKIKLDMKHIKGFNEEKRNSNEEDKAFWLGAEKKKLMSDLNDLTKKLKELEKKHDDKIKEIHVVEDKIDKLSKKKEKKSK